MGNMQSLRNTVDELQGNVRFQKDFRDCCIMAFTETWFTKQDQDTDLIIGGFGEPFCLDCKAEVTGETQGGGVCLYVNKRYCRSVTVGDQICLPDVELLSVSPHKFPQFLLRAVYIQPKAASASRTISDVLQKLYFKTLYFT